MIPVLMILASVVEPRAIQVGWHDELDSFKSWKSLGIQNQAFKACLRPSTVHLWLEHVPDGWPYSYQWSGITREAKADTRRFPIVLASVPQIQGYAHIDLDVLDQRGNVKKGLRSTTWTSGGVCRIDLRGEVTAESHKFRLRLIVGGDNSGCSATYDWVRFVSPESEDFMARNADFRSVTVRRTKRH